MENTLPNSSMARAKKGTQRHVIAGDETRTLCGIDTTKWSEKVDVEDETVNCPLCAEALKAAAKGAKVAAKAAEKSRSDI